MKNLILLLLILCGCERSAQQTYKPLGSDFYVEFLFEHEGMKVYRFHDGGQAVYFVNANCCCKAEKRVIYNPGSKTTTVIHKPILTVTND